MKIEIKENELALLKQLITAGHKSLTDKANDDLTPNIARSYLHILGVLDRKSVETRGRKANVVKKDKKQSSKV